MWEAIIRPWLCMMPFVAAFMFVVTWIFHKNGFFDHPYYHKAKLSFFGFAVDKDDMALLEKGEGFWLEWVGDNATMIIANDADDRYTVRAQGCLAVKKDGKIKFIDYEKELNSPEDWLSALNWLIENEVKGRK